LFFLLFSNIFFSGCIKRNFFARIKQKEPPAPIGTIAIILDDAGSTRECLFDIEKVDFPVTLAVLPSVAYSEQFCYVSNPLVRKIVHLPMEAERLYPGPGTIYTSMTEDELRKALEDIFSQFQELKGFNNHMGSVFMQDERSVRTVMLFAKENNLFFLNSMTVNDEKAGFLAKEIGVPYLERDVFLDNKADADYIKGQFLKCLDVARENSICIVLGHVRPLTVEVLNEVVPEAEKKGFRFLFLEDLYEGESRKNREERKKKIKD